MPKVKVLTIKTKHQPQHRDYLAGNARPFNVEARHIPLADIDAAEREELENDPWLHVQEQEIDLAEGLKSGDDEANRGNVDPIKTLMENPEGLVLKALPDLNDNDLRRAYEFEKGAPASDQREAVVKAIEAQFKKREKSASSPSTVLTGDYAEIIERLPKLTDAQLDAAHEFEIKGAKRVDVTKAIEAEFGRRTEPKTK